MNLVISCTVIANYEFAFYEDADRPKIVDFEALVCIKSKSMINLPIVFCAEAFSVKALYVLLLSSDFSPFFLSNKQVFLKEFPLIKPIK